MINVDITRTKSLVTDKELDLIAPRLAAAHDTLVGGTGAGSDGAARPPWPFRRNGRAAA